MINDEYNDRRNELATKREISIHIFSVSAAMVGVCLTVIGIFRAIAELRSLSTLGDDVLALDALLFLMSCILAYSSLRSATPARRERLERVADSIFILALSLMALVCASIVYSVF